VLDFEALRGGREQAHLQWFGVVEPPWQYAVLYELHRDGKVYRRSYTIDCALQCGVREALFGDWQPHGQAVTCCRRGSGVRVGRVLPAWTQRGVNASQRR
jgi:hypothetical protein